MVLTFCGKKLGKVGKKFGAVDVASFRGFFCLNLLHVVFVSTNLLSKSRGLVSVGRA